MSASSKPPRETLGETAKLGTGPSFDAFGPDYRPAALEHMVEARTVAATDYPATLAPAPAHMLVANETLTLAEAVARLYNAAGPGGHERTPAGVLAEGSPQATATDARVWLLTNGRRLDYVNGRALKLDSEKLRSGDPDALRFYDRDNGKGRGAEALKGEV